MGIESYLHFASPPDEEQVPPVDLVAADDDTLENLVHMKSRILDRKLDILAAEIAWRLRLGCQNLAEIQKDKSVLNDMLLKLDQLARYHLRDHQEKGVLYRKLFDLAAEGRTQQVECWRDVAMVMRDFLLVWEAHEQAQARAIFIQNVGAGTQGYL